ncbi:unnamed protein product [Mytilus edulis]|uniref:Uncharacterized protein n=1 Tax=Mytilus edulis TaxID=6550 RepID=A0A8S3S7T0_MYTED|nr:unnamed protein product [Mytilus edulis]
MEYVYNGLSGGEGFQTRSSLRDNTKWSKCITVYLALKFLKLEAVIETTPNGVFKLETVLETTPNGVSYNGLSGTEGFQTRSSQRGNTRWSKCITVYLALKVFKLEAVIETKPNGVDCDIHGNRIVKRSNALVEQLIKVQNQILLEHCRNSTYICSDSESRDCKCSGNGSVFFKQRRRFQLLKCKHLLDMKCLLSLLILIDCLSVQGILEWTVVGKVTDYGQNVTLFCNVPHCCPEDSGWDRWTPVQQTLFIDIKTGRPNKKKFLLKEDVFKSTSPTQPNSNGQLSHSEM